MTRELTVTNEMGIHARPASVIVEVAGKFSSDITFVKEDIRANAKSILNILLLAAEAGTVIDVEVEGEDETGRVQGKHKSTGIARPAFWDRARYYGREAELAMALDAAAD